MRYRNMAANRRDLSGFQQVKRVATKFFISNIPDGWSEPELWKIFKNYGCVVDLSLAKKRDRGGAKFRFVRFIKVDDVSALENKLNSIKIGHMELGRMKTQSDRVQQLSTCLGRKSDSEDGLDGMSNTIDYDDDERDGGWEDDGVTKEPDTKSIKRDKVTQELDLDDINIEERGNELHNGEKRNMGEENLFTREGDESDAMENDQHRDQRKLNKYAKHDEEEKEENAKGLRGDTEEIGNQINDNIRTLENSANAHFFRHHEIHMDPISRDDSTKGSSSTLCGSDELGTDQIHKSPSNSLDLNAEPEEAIRKQGVDMISPQEEREMRIEASMLEKFKGSTTSISSVFKKRKWLMSKTLCSLLWDFENFEIEASSSNGRSGGLFENVYTPNDPNVRKKIWKELLEFKSSTQGYYILMGDFNDVRGMDDRLSAFFCKSSMVAFNSFIKEAGLSEYNMGGRCLATVLALPREYSDHNPIILLGDNVDFCLAKAWSDKVEVGNADTILLNKLQTFRKNLKNGVKDAVWSCSSEKAPGPDGFTFKFLKEYWDISHAEVLQAVKHFERSGEISKGCNAYFISLIPKIRDPITLKDYRLISLIGCFVKIISKMLARRLKELIHSIVGEEQSTYIQGRNILDGPFIINEVCYWAKKSKTKSVLFKVDLDRAFDSVDWCNLDSILSKMNFGPKWRGWIRDILKSGRGLILVNRAPTKEFNIQKKVETGGSPFSILIHHSHGRIARASGLKVNFSKSKVYGIGVDKVELSCLANYLGSLVKVIEILERIRRKFLWNGSEDKKSNNWVVWDKVTTPNPWGSGVNGLKNFNICLLAKWWWKLKHDASSLWSKNVTEIEDDFLEVGISLRDLFRRKVGRRDKTRFWKDMWITGIRLKDKFPRLYRLENEKNCLFMDRVMITIETGVDLKWNRKKQNTSYMEKSQLQGCLELIDNFEFSPKSDSWEWVIENNRLFSVKSIRNALDISVKDDIPKLFKWNSFQTRCVHLGACSLSLLWFNSGCLVLLGSPYWSSGLSITFRFLFIRRVVEISSKWVVYLVRLKRGLGSVCFVQTLILGDNFRLSLEFGYLGPGFIPPPFILPMVALHHSAKADTIQPHDLQKFLSHDVLPVYEPPQLNSFTTTSFFLYCDTTTTTGVSRSASVVTLPLGRCPVFSLAGMVTCQSLSLPTAPQYISSVRVVSRGLEGIGFIVK
ncbi:hypothetical protein L1887_08814 [Cichorium endivia]|nr:hypothetical protein L1887_08814 [Cichorium endivia]